MTDFDGELFHLAQVLRRYGGSSYAVPLSDSLAELAESERQEMNRLEPGSIERHTAAVTSHLLAVLSLLVVDFGLDLRENAAGVREWLASVQPSDFGDPE